MTDTVSVKVWGEYALFNQLGFPVERFSYPVMTPSAARGILEAIFFKPQMRWRVRRITALKPQFPTCVSESEREKPFRLMSVRRNEVKEGASPRAVAGWAKDHSTFEPYLADQNRTQRTSQILNHVAYRIDAAVQLTAKANLPRLRPDGEDERGPDTVAKYVAMFNRRVERGQCFHRPYLGCREFACHFAPPSGRDEPLARWSLDFGLMPYDMQYGVAGGNRLGLFVARVTGGVLHCDTEAAGPNGEPPVRVVGWVNEGGAA